MPPRRETMKFFRRHFFRSRAWWLVVGFAGALGGCKDFFIVKQKVIVDAISAPTAAKLSGLSYRLVAKKSVVLGQNAQLPVIAACINSALIQVGMFEAPPNVPSDIFIEVAYGMDTAGRVDPSRRETFLEWSARTNRAHSLETSREEEVLDHVSRGMTNKEIARQLSLSEKTVKHYMTIIMQKLQVRNRVEAVLQSRRKQ